MPDELISPYQKKRYDKLKSEAVLPDDTSWIGQEAQAPDPYATHKSNGGLKMQKKKVLDEEIENPEESEKAKKEEMPEKPKDEVEKKEEEEETKQETLDEEEEDEEKKKKKKKKQAENPEESNEDAAQSGENTITPGMDTPSKPQNVFVPPSSTDASREQDVPIEEPMSKAAELELSKSPLFLNLSAQIDKIKEAMSKKLDSVEKSVNDRLNNVLKDMGKIEKFYKQSFYKAAGENVAPEGVQALSIEKQLEMGKVRFRNK
jgi:hypothetical protein